MYMYMYFFRISNNKTMLAVDQTYLGIQIPCRREPTYDSAAKPRKNRNFSQTQS